jgi:hypothetical protein
MRDLGAARAHGATAFGPENEASAAHAIAIDAKHAVRPMMNGCSPALISSLSVVRALPRGALGLQSGIRDEPGR